MKIAVIGSRGITKIDLGKYLPEGTTEIVSGGAKGVDTCAAQYARANGLKLTEFLPDYETYGRGAPLVRNEQIVDYCDKLIAFWDGKSTGTVYTVKACVRKGVPFKASSNKPDAVMDLS